MVCPTALGVKVVDVGGSAIAPKITTESWIKARAFLFYLKRTCTLHRSTDNGVDCSGTRVWHSVGYKW